MDILIIGGTRFLGRHIVERALSRGHNVTMFNRGKGNPDLFPEVERIIGDRAEGLSGIEGRKWDAVVDTCGYFPRIVKMSVDALQSKVAQYVFISTISVYADAEGEIDESSPVNKIEDGTVEEIRGDTYGALKALCENVVKEGFPEGALIIRPGLIVGPNDPTDRFTYWPLRMARGGDVLVPDRKEQPCQIIDVRDLADWTVDMVEKQATGTFNGTGPQEPYTIGEVIEKCHSVAGEGSKLVWVDPQFLAEKEVEPWSDLPFVLPYDGSGDFMSRVDVSRAVAEGLTFTSLEDTIRATMEWARQEGLGEELKAGLAPDRERELLNAWKAQA